jgi:clan AA aspartic protease (TIGR02281 family)
MKRYLFYFLFFPFLSYAQVDNKKEKVKKNHKPASYFSNENYEKHITDSIEKAEILLMEKEVEKAMRVSDSAWTPAKEEELKAIVYAAKGMDKFPDSVKMKFYKCILWKSKVRIPDAVFNRESDKQIMIDISTECAEECDMNLSNYKENITLVKTKDGVSLGNRSEFIAACAKESDKKIININGLEIEAYKYCACACDNLIPTINSWEIEKAIKENKMNEFLLEDTNLDILMKCLDGNYKVNDDYKFAQTDNPELVKKVAIKNCVNELINNVEVKENWTKESAEEYCNCAMNKLLSAGYTYKDILEIEDENSSIFNEIAVPCVSEVLKTKNEFKSSNIYNINDIKGGSHRSLISLTDYFGKGYKVKITIAGVSKYYLFDTGASDLIIDRDTERELLLNGVLKRENYLNKTEYTLANNQTVKGQKVKVDNIVIGDYTLNNVVIAIIDDGSLLCGMSFLDKFKKWELDKQNNVLILYK